VIVETYKGRKIRAVKGKDRWWGSTRIVLNGVDQGHYDGDEAKAVASVKRTIDAAESVGVTEARYGAEWYAPGTYDLCPVGHETPIGGECGHHWCVSRKANNATSEASEARP
jgi:hypothetical protein